MAKKCKDCDPNKYIEGVAYRGRNGHSFDGVYSYNDVGQPYDSNENPTTDMLANVSDMLDAYNPIFTSKFATGLSDSLNNPLYVKGIDKDRGFWFIWSFIDGIVAYNSPRSSVTAPAIISSGTTTAKLNQNFNFSIQTDKIPSILTYTNFGQFADQDSSDKLRFSKSLTNQSYTQTGENITITLSNNSIFTLGEFVFCKFISGSQNKHDSYQIIGATSTTITIRIPGSLTTSGSVDLYSFKYFNPSSTNNSLLKNKINYVGYYTGFINATLIGTTANYTSKKSLTIKSLSSDGTEPIYVTSNPTIHAFRGNSFVYQITTNLDISQYDVLMSRAQLDIINNLNLTWNSETKVIQGTINPQIDAELKTEAWTFEIRAKRGADVGNRTTFNLNILKGNLNASINFPGVPGAFTPYSLTGTVGKSFNSKLSIHNSNIVGISNLPEGLNFNSSNNLITGTPKHAGVFTSKISASNARGTNQGTIIFTFSPFEENNRPSGTTYPSEIQLLQNSYSVLRNNKITLRLRSKRTRMVSPQPPKPSEEIYFKKINKSEYNYIKQNNFPAPFSANYIYNANSPTVIFSLNSPHNFVVGTYLDVTFQANSSLKAGRFLITSIINNTTVEVNLGDKTSNKSTASETATVSSYVVALNGTDISNISFVPRDSLEAETNFWIYIIDTNTTDAFPIEIEGSYDISSILPAQIDGIGNACFAPQNSEAKGAVSTPFTQEIAVTASSLVKSAWSANPAENIPVISFNPGPNLEHQIIFLSGPLEVQTAFANQTLPKSGVKKYPNGVPTSNGTYTFFIRLFDTCTFNRVTSEFVLFLGTYTPRVGDVYVCTYRATCFTKKMRVNTPKGKINIDKLKIGNEVYAFDEDKNIHISKIIKIIDHNKISQPVFKVKLENGTVLESTLSHQFLDGDGNFKFLGEMKAGEYLFSFGKKVKILSIDQSHMEEVYNFEIDKYHTYIVEDIFVHNGGHAPRKNSYNYNANYTLTSNSIPGNCHTLVSRIGDTITYNNYAYQYRNNLSESKDIGITSLTNISLLDILGEGPIEGIVNYEIKPRPGYQKGDIGYKNGVDLVKYPGQNSFIRSIYWNETALADDTFPNPGSVNFDFIKLKFDNADCAPRHADITQLSNIRLEEEFYSKKAGNGIYVNHLEFRDQNNNLLSSFAKLPRRLTSTKTVGTRLFGKRKFQDNTERSYKKSINILTKDLYGLRLHIKVISLFKQIVDLRIFESASEAESNSEGGRIDRQSVTFNITLKRIDKGSGSEGFIITPINVGANKTSLPLVITGRLNSGPYIETFEWTGLTTVSNQRTVGWEIEIEPTYTEPIDNNVVLKTGIDSITETYNELLILPNTAAIMTTFDARFFSSIPQRSYDTRLLKVKVPLNYNPYSKTYDGIWNGAFKLAWTDNPAWCFYDLLTNRRYGLGKYVDPRYTDKWTLYEIGKYCDQLVSDGKGGLEPRFTCNMLISTREDAYKVVNDMASIFRGLVYYSAGLIMISQDRPKDAIYIFNNSNVKDGEFTYSNTSRRVRRNIALVRYNDKDNFFKPAVKYVENREGIIRYGIRETEVSAFGCTSEGQAERLGKWTLISENSESELVSFETSLPAMYLKPGDIVLIQDQNRQNKILGGRTYELNKNYAILDVKYENISGYLPVISGCKFNILTPAGNIEIGTPSGNYLTDLQEQQQANVFKERVLNDIEFMTTEGMQSGINTSVIRRKQIQTINYNIENDDTSSNSFGAYVSLETGINYNGYTKLSFGSARLDDKEHTLLQNTVWTIELDPKKYDHTKSPSISGKSSASLYPGASLEPYIDRTQKFRVLDIEEQEEYRYKITALQYEESKYDMGDDI